MTDKDIKDYCKNCDVEPPAMRFKCPECEHNTDNENIFAKDINVPSKEQANDSLKNSDKNFNENCTQEKEQIMIDGVNIIGTIDEWARLVAHEWGTDEYSDAEIVKNYILDINKQLARKTQECEELRVAYNKAQDIIGRVNGANELKSYSLQESIKECDRYRKALEEIEEYCNNSISITGELPFKTTESDIIDIINKAKDKICYWNKNIDMSKATLQVNGKVICRFDNDNQMVIINDNYSDTTKDDE